MNVQPGTYGSYIWLQTCQPDTIMHIVGDIDHNVGSFVRAILANPSASLPWKIALVCTDSMPYADILKVWNEVTGRRGTYVSLTMDQARSIFGPFEEEVGRRFRLNGAESDWCKAHNGQMTTWKGLGIEESDLVDMRGSFERNIDKL
jgi:hypothetical protein